MNEVGRVDDIGEVLWRRHAAELLRYATLLIGAADADDVVSAVFLRATASGRRPDNIRAYLFRAVLNEVLDQRRSSRRRRLRDRHAVLRDASDPPEAHNDLRKAILTLTPRQRAVVYFAFWEDLDSAAIAKILRVNPSTIRRELSRVKQQLQEALS